MYEWDEQTKQVTFSHNPFSLPQGGLWRRSRARTRSRSWRTSTTSCNGIELSSGAIRNHRPDVMVKAFEIAGYGRDVLEARFGGMFARCTTARRRTAAWRRASTASSC